MNIFYIFFLIFISFFEIFIFMWSYDSNFLQTKNKY